MASTTNYSWTTPDNSGLVKNGAQDIRTLGSAIDTSLWNVGYGQAGKNKIINGDFGIWQRGTSITFADNSYTADRFITLVNSGTAGTGTVTRQTFTPGTAPVAGYEGQYFWRYNLTATGTSVEHYVGQKIEDVRTFAGQTVTFSFWGKADSARTITSQVLQLFGSGGSGTVVTAGTTHSFTTSWQRFSVTISVPSISGKTIGTGSNLLPRFYWTAAAGATIDTWGWQIEAGSVATAFQTATGTIQGELAACQRYFWRITSGSGNNYQKFSLGHFQTTTTFNFILPLRTSMRTTPSISTSGSFTTHQGTSQKGTAAPTLQGDGSGSEVINLNATVASATEGYAGYIRAENSTSTFIDISAEL